MANNEVKTTGENLNKEPAVSEEVQIGHSTRSRIIGTFALIALSAGIAMGSGCDTNVDDDDTGDDDTAEVDTTPPGAPSMDATGTMEVAENTTIPVTGEVPNPEDTEKVQYRLNGGAWVDVDSYSPGDGDFSFDVEVGTEPVKVEVQAVDAADNESGSGDDLTLDPMDETPPEDPAVNPDQVQVAPNDNEFEVSVSVNADVEEVNVYNSEGELVNNTVITQGSTDFQLTVDHEPGVETDYTFTTVDVNGNESPGTVVPVEVVYEAPVISGLDITCGEWGCLSAGEVYPVTFNVTDATNGSASVELISGLGTAGSVDNFTLEDGVGRFEYTTGSTADDVVRITVEATGPGGNSSNSIDITLE